MNRTVKLPGHVLEKFNDFRRIPLKHRGLPPLWGSEKVRSLLTKRLAAVGGVLSHLDHPAEPQEVLEWFEE